MYEGEKIKNKTSYNLYEWTMELIDLFRDSI